MNTKEIVPRLVSAVAGAIVLAIVGFSWGGWYTAGQAKDYRQVGIQETHIGYLAQDCAEKFMAQPDAATTLVTLRDTRSSYDQAKLIPEDWRKLPGSSSANSVLAAACIKMILTPANPGEAASSG